METCVLEPYCLQFAKGEVYHCFSHEHVTSNLKLILIDVQIA
jgi:hypothetical protein